MLMYLVVPSFPSLKNVLFLSFFTYGTFLSCKVSLTPAPLVKPLFIYCDCSKSIMSDKPEVEYKIKAHDYDYYQLANFILSKLSFKS